MNPQVWDQVHDSAFLTRFLSSEVLTRCCYLAKQKALPGTCNSIKFRVLLSSFQSSPPSLQPEIECVDYRDAQTGVRLTH